MRVTHSAKQVTASRCVKQIAAHLQSLSQPQVVDLGAASQSTLGFLAKYHCKISILDLNEAIATKQELNKELIQKLNTIENIDIILCWNLFNYIKEDLLHELLNIFASKSNAKALIHFFMNDKVNIPAIPETIAIDRNENLLLTNHDCGMVPCVRHSLRNIKMKLHNFNSKSSSLLQNGIQENLWINSETDGAKLDLLMG